MKQKLYAAILLLLPVLGWAALESATYINQLNEANPTGTDHYSTADDHLRLIKSTIKATFPNLSGAVTSDQAELNLLDGRTGTVWTSTNDGAASTLDADLLDGNSSAFYLDLTNASAGTLAVARGGTGTTTSTGTGNVVLSASPTFTGTVTAATLNATTLQQGGTGVSLTGHAHSAADVTSGTLPVARGGTGTTTSTGSGNLVLSVSPTFTGTVQTAGISASNTVTATGFFIGTDQLQSAGFQRIARMRNTFAGSGGCTVSDGSGITSCTRYATGGYTVSYVAAGFNSAPVCVGSLSVINGHIIVTGASSAQVTVLTQTGSFTDVDTNWTLICMGT